MRKVCEKGLFRRVCYEGLMVWCKEEVTGGSFKGGVCNEGLLIRGLSRGFVVGGSYRAKNCLQQKGGWWSCEGPSRAYACMGRIDDDNDISLVFLSRVVCDCDCDCECDCDSECCDCDCECCDGDSECEC